MTTEPQMFLDRGEDSFVAEVIQILAMTTLHIDVRDRNSTIDELAFPEGMTVRVKFAGDLPAGLAAHARTSRHVMFLGYGRSYGQALRDVREQLRDEVGR